MVLVSTIAYDHLLIFVSFWFFKVIYDKFDK